MSEDKDITAKLELLRMARELVLNEYIDRRAQDHNKWLADADVAWRTNGIKLPYPSFPIYPTEEEIITRAVSLHDFLSKSKPVVETPIVTEVAPVEIEPAPIVAEVAPPVIEVEATPVKPIKEESTFEKMVPPVLEKIEQFKSVWSLK
jgi:hypothetical protein